MFFCSPPIQYSSLEKSPVDASDLLASASAPLLRRPPPPRLHHCDQQVDPAGERTLGVITKCDMAGIDTGLVGKLLAEEKKHVRLALGMVGVRNRTQTEVNDGISPEEVRLREAQFFETSAAARGLPRRFWGMDTLTNRIVELQSNKVNHWMQTIQVGRRL